MASVLRDANGHLVTSPDGLKSCRHTHFDKVLNIPSSFNLRVIEDLPAAESRHGLEDASNMEELMAAIQSLNCSTAGEQSGIVPEIILCGGAALHMRIHDLICKVWHDRVIVAEWQGAEMVRVLEKGDLSSCDNWHGISLLGAVGKLFTRILQDRLQEMMKDILPDSQRGFRKGLGCVDMMFVARQLAEKAVEHNSEMYVLFVDLRKVYDSICDTVACFGKGRNSTVKCSRF